MALRCYREALADSPLSEPAKTRAEILTAVLEKKVRLVMTCHVTCSVFLFHHFILNWLLPLVLFRFILNIEFFRNVTFFF